MQQVGLLRRQQWALAAKPIRRGVNQNLSGFIALFRQTQQDFRRVGVSSDAQGRVVLLQQFEKLSQGGAHSCSSWVIDRANKTRAVRGYRDCSVWLRHIENQRLLGRDVLQDSPSVE